MAFILKVLPVIVFFIIGDIATTLYALQLPGLHESNPMLQNLVSHPILFILLKCSVLIVLYVLYKTSTTGWFRVYAAIPSFVGIALCVNNIIRILSV